MHGVLASFDSGWGATFTVVLAAVGVWLAVAALLGWLVSRSPLGAVVATVVAVAVVGVAVRAYPEGNTGLVASVPMGLLIGVGSAGLLGVGRRQDRAVRADRPDGYGD